MALEPSAERKIRGGGFIYIYLHVWGQGVGGKRRGRAHARTRRRLGARARTYRRDRDLYRIHTARGVGGSGGGLVVIVGSGRGVVGSVSGQHPPPPASNHPTHAHHDHACPFNPCRPHFAPRIPAPVRKCSYRAVVLVSAVPKNMDRTHLYNPQPTRTPTTHPPVWPGPARPYPHAIYP